MRRRRKRSVFTDLTSTRAQSGWVLPDSITHIIITTITISQRVPLLLPVRAGLLLISEKTIITHIKQLLHMQRNEGPPPPPAKSHTELHCSQNLNMNSLKILSQVQECGITGFNVQFVLNCNKHFRFL